MSSFNFTSCVGWKYPWVVPLGTTSRNEKGTKNNKIIFMGLLFQMFSQLYIFSHVYKLHALIYGLKFNLELNNLKIVKILYS
jgi:hypothetical protein